MTVQRFIARAECRVCDWRTEADVKPGGTVAEEVDKAAAKHVKKHGHTVVSGQERADAKRTD